MRVVYRVGLAFLCVLATPMAAWAVRPHASGSLVGYRGVDPEGPVSFTILITDSSHGSDYSATGFRIATECNRAGVRLPDSVTITRHERGTPRTLHFELSPARGGDRTDGLRPVVVHGARDRPDLIASMRRRHVAVPGVRGSLIRAATRRRTEPRAVCGALSSSSDKPALPIVEMPTRGLHVGPPSAISRAPFASAQTIS